MWLFRFRTITTTVALALALSAVVVRTYADTSSSSFRCGSHLISRGDSKPEVLERCGQPEYAETIPGGSPYYAGVREERWYYPKRTGHMRPVVVFGSDGRVREIRMEQ